MKKMVILMLVFLFTCMVIQAQYTCYEPESEIPMRTDLCHRVFPINWEDESLLISSYIPTTNTPIITIPVNINVWREDNGTGNWWLDTPAYRDSLQKAFDYLNQIYGHNEEYTLYIPNAQFILDTRVRFVIDTVCYYNNSIMAHNYYTFQFTNYLLSNHPERLNRFNYHLSLDTTQVWSGVSSGYDAQYPSIVTIKQCENREVDLYAFALHMAHEFGHDFGLHHTYNTENTVIAHPEFLWDVFGTETQDWCDAPATRVCYHEGNWACNPLDSTNTCTNNIMGGTCMSRHFSALQCGRIHRALGVSTLKDFAYGDTSSSVIHISSNLELDYTRKFYQSIVVDSGVTLTVTCRMEMSPDTRVIVNPGGKLIVDGGTLTSAEPGTMWKGIEVVGDRTKHQEPQYQGVVELKNGAVIENAITAIRTGLLDEGWHTTGGIITATNAIFRNNQRSLEFLSYCDTDSAANLLNNCSYFVGCTFTIDTNNVLAQNNRQFTNHVTMWDVKNVRFKGCTFENKMNRGRLCEGKGIATIDAGFSLTTYPFPYATYSGGGSFLPDTFLFNTFTGFYTAVEVTTTGNQYAVKLDETKFNNNQQAISVYGNNHVEVIRCDVNQTDYKASMVYQRKGISLENSTGYHIEKNQFYDYYYSPSSQSNNSKYGIKITNSGTNNNRIYKNDFTKMANGILVSGTNGNVKRGLQFICNNFSTNDYDIRLMHYATIAPCQGQINSGADNNFSGTYDYNIYNSSFPDITYLYSSSNPAHYPSLAYHVTPLSNGISTNPCYSTIFDINLNRTDYNTSDLAAMVSAYQELDSARVSQWEMTEEGTYNTSPVSPEMMALQQEASDLYYKAVRQIMLDSLTDMATLAEWHATASVFADPYSWSETMYQMNETAEYASIVTDDTAERDNYAAFRALKSECASLTTEKGVNWYAMSEEQIERLIRIAELNTGRTSVMAKGILCFFFNICYEKEEETMDTYNATCQETELPNTYMENEANTSITDNQENIQAAGLIIYPNPANQTFTISFSEAQESVKQVRIINMQGKVVLSQENPSNNTVNIANLPVGMYVVRVLSQSGKEYAVKLVKE